MAHRDMVSHLYETGYVFVEPMVLYNLNGKMDTHAVLMMKTIMWYLTHYYLLKLLKTMMMLMAKHLLQNDNHLLAVMMRTMMILTVDLN